jgi:hypothetical protein
MICSRSFKRTHLGQLIGTVQQARFSEQNHASGFAGFLARGSPQRPCCSWLSCPLAGPQARHCDWARWSNSSAWRCRSFAISHLACSLAPSFLSPQLLHPSCLLQLHDHPPPVFVSLLIVALYCLFASRLSLAVNHFDDLPPAAFHFCKHPLKAVCLVVPSLSKSLPTLVTSSIFDSVRFASLFFTYSKLVLGFRALVATETCRACRVVH